MAAALSPAESNDSSRECLLWVVSGLLVNADIELVYCTPADSRQHASCCDLIRNGDTDGMHKANGSEVH